MMANAEANTEGIVRLFEGTSQFTYKSYWRHLWAFLRKPLPILAAAVAVFSVFVTFAEASIQFGGGDPRRWLSYSLLVVSSLIVSFVWNGYVYSRHVPEGFEGVSSRAARIAHWQRPRWQYQLAKTLLAEKLGPLDRELRDMTAGRVFVEAHMPATYDAYFRWARTRPQNLLVMLKTANEVIRMFTQALHSTVEKPAEPRKVLEAVESLARFYGETVAFERSSRSIMPSEVLKALHECQLGWSDPIRDGIHQLFRVLQEVTDRDVSVDNVIDCTITFPAPANVDEFTQELSSLSRRAHEIVREW